MSLLLLFVLIQYISLIAILFNLFIEHFKLLIDKQYLSLHYLNLISIKITILPPVWYEVSTFSCIKCDGHNNIKCEKDYIGETEKTLKARFMEHRTASSNTIEVARHIHQDCPWHAVSLESVKNSGLPYWTNSYRGLRYKTISK